MILDLRKCPNQKTHESESECFLFPAIPAVQNKYWKQFSNKVLYTYCKKKKFEGFGQYLKKSEKWISHCILNLCTEGFGVYFHARVLFFSSPNAIYYLTQQPWGAPNLKFWPLTIYPIIDILYPDFFFNKSAPSENLCLLDLFSDTIF